MAQHKKQNINVIIIGHQRCGKSTLTSHLVCKSDGVNKDKALYYENEAEKLCKGSFKYTWVLEKLSEERERGATVNLSLWNFETSKYFVTVIDAPGHKDALRETAAGVTQGVDYWYEGIIGGISKLFGRLTEVTAAIVMYILVPT